MGKTDVLGLMQPHLRDLKPYAPHLYDNVIHLEANENPYPFPRDVEQAICQRMQESAFSRYPDPSAEQLRRKLGETLGLAPDYFMCGAGSDEVIHTMFLAFTGPGSNVLISVPTFSMYKISAIIAGANPVEVPMLPGFQLDMERLLVEAQRPETRIVMVCSPNNPTGNLVPLKDIEALCQAATGLVVVDEAYFEFAKETALPLLEQYPNLVILRTFSKAYGLAGLRVGYMIANPEVTAQVMKVRQPYNLNSFSQMAAITVLEQREGFQQVVQQIMENQRELGQELAQLEGVYVYPSDCNYFLVKLLSADAQEVHDQLVTKGVLVRFLGNGFGVENCLRVSVGTKEENVYFLEKLRECLR